MGRVQRSRQAREDALSIWEFVAQDNVNAADAMIRKFDAIAELAAENPYIGVPQFQYRDGLRCLSAGNYILFYEPVDDGILIIRILHGARRIEDLL